MELINKVMAFFQSNMIQVIGGFLYLCVEYWLGTTSVVKAGSTLEAVLNGIKKVLEVLKIKKPSV